MLTFPPLPPLCTWLLAHRWLVLGPVVMTVFVLIVLAIVSHFATPIAMEPME